MEKNEHPPPKSRVLLLDAESFQYHQSHKNALSFQGNYLEQIFSFPKRHREVGATPKTKYPRGYSGIER